MKKNILTVWKNFSVKAGNFQTNIILTVFYCIIIIPLAFFLKLLTKNPFIVENSKDTWSSKEKNINDVKGMRIQS